MKTPCITISITSILFLFSTCLIAQESETPMELLKKKGFDIEAVNAKRPKGSQVYGEKVEPAVFIGCYQYSRSYFLPKTAIEEVSVRTSGISSKYANKLEGEISLREVRPFSIQSSRWKYSYYSLKPKHEYF